MHSVSDFWGAVLSRNPSKDSLRRASSAAMAVDQGGVGVGGSSGVEVDVAEQSAGALGAGESSHGAPGELLISIDEIAAITAEEVGDDLSGTDADLCQMINLNELSALVAETNEALPGDGYAPNYGSAAAVAPPPARRPPATAAGAMPPPSFTPGVLPTPISMQSSARTTARLPTPPPPLSFVCVCVYARARVCV